MTRPRTPAERTAAARSAVSYAYVEQDHALFADASPSPFNGIWVHSTSVGQLIRTGGWKPDLVRNTIYGAAVYLSRKRWDASHRDVFECGLKLRANECLAHFSSASESGSMEKHVIWHLKDAGLTVGINPSVGHSTQNQAIARHFRGQGIKAIHFNERGTDVVAVYDPSCIVVLT